MAKSTYNYYNPAGHPFDEVFAEVEGNIASISSNEDKH